MKRLYEPDAYDTGKTAGAWWEETVDAPLDFPRIDGHVRTHTAIIGGGYTGLNAALQLAETHHADCLVVDAAQPAWGASGRNGGFACLGGAKLPVDQQIKRFGLEQTKKFYTAQLQAVETVRDNLKRYNIDADTHSKGGELCLAHNKRHFKDLCEEAEFSRITFGLSSEIIPQDAMPDHGIVGNGLLGAIRTSAGFALNPLKYAQGLARALKAKGVPVLANSPVTKIVHDVSGFLLHCPTGTIRAQKVIIATNGYSSDDIPPELGPRFLPMLSSILVTRPITLDEQNQQGWTSDLMSYDSRKLLHYFRLMPDGRFLFGQRGALRADMRHTEANKRKNRADFERMFPAWQGVETTHFWSGLICTTRNRHPFIGALEGRPGLFAALGYHGNGVTMASYAGRKIADLASGAKPELPAALHSPLWRFPLPSLRRQYLRAAILGFRFSDML